MALINVEYKDFVEDRNHFHDLYDCSYEEFIEEYGDDKIEIDLKDKIVVALSHEDGNNMPVCIHSIFIPEGDRYKYTSKLVYVGHIAFLIVEFKNGKKRMFYKDDECYPQNFEDCITCGDILFCAEENGFNREDILSQIEKTIQINHNFKFKLKEEQLVMLEGL